MWRWTGSKKIWLQKSLETRKAMVERDHEKISIKRQTELLSVNRSSVYRPEKQSRERGERRDHASQR